MKIKKYKTSKSKSKLTFWKGKLTGIFYKFLKKNPKGRGLY